MATPNRTRVGRFRLLTLAADALRHPSTTDAGHAAADCPRCADTVRTRQPATPGDTGREGGPLHAALLDHLFHDCPATEVAR